MTSLHGDVGLASAGHLPQAGEPGQNASADGAELGAEPRQVVVGEGAGPDQAHLADQHVPQLRQLVEGWCGRSSRPTPGRTRGSFLSLQ